MKRNEGGEIKLENSFYRCREVAQTISRLRPGHFLFFAIYIKFHVKKTRHRREREAKLVRNFLKRMESQTETPPSSSLRSRSISLSLSFLFSHFLPSFVVSVARIRYVSTTIYEPSKHFAQINWKHASSAARKSCEENPDASATR